MHDVFVFGTLCHRPLLELVAGGAVRAEPAVLADARVVQAADGPWPLLIDAAGTTASGLLLTLTEAQRARLDFYEACFDYHRVPVTVLVGGEPRQAEAWAPAGNNGATATSVSWSLDDWTRAWAEITLRAAEEVMRQFPDTPPDEIAQRFWMIRARAQSHYRAGNWRRPARVGAGFTRADVTVAERRFPYDRFFGVEELRLSARQFDGGQSALQERAVFKVADAVTVLPYDPARDRILLIEQLRFGAYVQGDAAPWLLEPVAGIVDAGETPEACARRETHEEAGIALGELHFVAAYYPSPGGIAQVIRSYVAIADLPDGVTGINGAEGEGEDILSHLVPYDLAGQLLQEGEMANAPLILSFQWLQMNRDRLRRAG
jgi:nudix-type nucleoside diphosphatase (YffH/AdpP family)